MDQISELEQRVFEFKERLDRFLADLGELADVQKGLIEEAAEIEAELDRARAASFGSDTLLGRIQRLPFPQSPSADLVAP